MDNYLLIAIAIGLVAPVVIIINIAYHRLNRNRLKRKIIQDRLNRL